MKTTNTTTPEEALHNKIVEPLTLPITDHDEMADRLMLSLGLHTEYAGEGVGRDENGNSPDVYTVRAHGLEIYPHD